MTRRMVCHMIVEAAGIESRASGRAPASLRSFIEVREYDAHRQVSFENIIVLKTTLAKFCPLRLVNEKR
jgi:hypothetical protein